jgi:uncharacterized membrane protein YphA (DoxX/SURF4 family)
MSTNIYSAPGTASPSPSKTGLIIALWIAQVLVAGMFGMAGTMKLLNTEMFAQHMGAPTALVLFIGISEVAGTLGILLPAISRILPILTPIAASGLAIVGILATGFHVMHGEFGSLPVPLALAALSVFVAWGRFYAAPIRPRA